MVVVVGGFDEFGNHSNLMRGEATEHADKYALEEDGVLQSRVGLEKVIAGEVQATQVLLGV